LQADVDLAIDQQVMAGAGAGGLQHLVVLGEFQAVLLRDLLPVEEAAFGHGEDADGAALQVLDLGELLLRDDEMAELAGVRRDHAQRPAALDVLDDALDRRQHEIELALHQPGGLAFAAADETDVGVEAFVGEIAILDRDEHRLRKEGAVDQADRDGLAGAMLRLRRRWRGRDRQQRQRQRYKPKACRDPHGLA
jgi:hypothetical protein